MMKPERVVVYADPLLAPTMTFVRAQALCMESFSPVFVGPRRIRTGLDLPAQKVLVIHQNGGQLGKLREIPLKVFGYAPFFFRRVRRFNPVLVHAHFGPAALTSLPMARSLGIPLIVTFHGYDATVYEEYLRRANYRCWVYAKQKDVLQRSGRLFVAVSEFIRRCIVEQGYPEDKTVVHYIGIDAEFFSPGPVQARENIVLFVATLTEKKGCEYLIRAMADVQSRMPGLELVVIGDGPLRRSLEEKARKSLPKFRFLGVQPPEIVREWMNRAKVFSVPSIRAQSGDTEGFGMVFAEAQAMGLPVASFASGGIPEAVEHGTTGLLAREKDWQSLAENILFLLKNENLRNQMGEAGQARVRSCFDVKKQTAKLEEIYRGILGSSRIATRESSLHT